MRYTFPALLWLATLSQRSEARHFLSGGFISMAVNRSKYSPTAIINTPPEQRKHLLARLWLPAVLLLALAAGGLTGIIAAYELNYSRAANEVAALATYRPSVVTRVYADDGETVIGEFALEKRIPLKYEEIPPVLKN